MSKITDVELEFDQMTLERMPEHAIDELRRRKAQALAKPQAVTHIHERMGNRLDMPVPHDLRGRKVRVTLEVIE